jgi:hypothetical protein
MITDKIENDKNKKTGLITKIEDMAKSMGVSKDELIKILGGKVPSADDDKEEVAAKPVQIQPQQTQQPQQSKQPQDDGFKTVDGSLKSSSRTNLRVDSDANDYIAPAVPAYSVVKNKDNQTVIETNKKVKTVDNVMMSKSDMGTTAIAVAPGNVGEINKVITAVNKQTHELIRANASGNGNTARECPVCKGSGITVINSKVCVKCNGSGFIFV